jgi:hypothetical protein
MMQGAQEAQGEILYFCDADVEAKPNLLNILLANFEDPNVVAVSGCPFHSNGVPLVLDVLWHVVNSSLTLKVNGASLAVRRDIFFSLGGFNTEIDQFDRSEMQMEEEIGFVEKLKSAGTVIVDAQATINVPARLQTCCGNADPTKPLCRYCMERLAGQRF